MHEVDLSALLAAGGVFTAIRDDRATFDAIVVNPELWSIEWPGEVDLDPDVLRGDQRPASGAELPRRVAQPA